MPLDSMRPLPCVSNISIFMGCPSSATSLNWLFAFKASAFCSNTTSASPVERPLHGITGLTQNLTALLKLKAPAMSFKAVHD